MSCIFVSLSILLKCIKENFNFENKNILNVIKLTQAESKILRKNNEKFDTPLYLWVVDISYVRIYLFVSNLNIT